MAINIIKMEDIEKKIKTGGILLVNFFAHWCGTCQMLTPILEEISEKYDVYKIDIDKNKGVREKEDIGNIPHTRIYKDGNIVDQISGYVSIEKINEIIAKA